MKKLLTVVCLVLFAHLSNAAFVDYGLTLGEFDNVGSLLINGGRFELGTFTGYTDGAGASYFTGKTYTDLRTSYVLYGDSVSTTDTAGQFYTTVNLLTTPTNARLFAWAFSTTTASSSANWSIVSGTIGGATAYDPLWLAVASTDSTVNAIEIGVTSNVLYANSNPGNTLAPSIVYDPSGANLSVVPEPATWALLAGSLTTVGMLRRRRSRL